MYQPLLVLVIAVNIEFLTEFGDLPLLRSDLSAIRNIDPYLATLQNGYIMNITEYQKGMHTWMCDAMQINTLVEQYNSYDWYNTNGFYI